MKKAITIVFVALFLSAAISAQTTEFTFQGRLLDNTLPATGNYDMQFRLWTSDTGGGGGGLGVETRPNVAVSQGIFTVVLDFGNLFTGPERWIEISIRPAGSSEQYLTLSGRQRLTSTPYAIKSLNSDTATTATNSMQLGNVPASEYVITTDPRMSDERQPAPFSGNYIQNTPSQQAASNFFISGLGRANILSANTQFNLGTNRILAAPGSFNFFAGIGTGASITTGISNTLVGGQAGDSLSQGGNNSFYGAQAGRSTTSANGNSFFGASAGRLNTSGGLNSFFGLNSGEQTTIGADNSFFGAFSGSGNSNGSGNSFFGSGSGSSNSSGNSNSFFGFSAGAANTDGQGNSFYGAQSGLVNSTGSANSFFGHGSGRANTTGSSNTFVGVESGFSNTLGASNVFVGTSAGRANAAGARNAIVGSFAGAVATGDDNAFFGGSAGLNNIAGSENSLFGGFAGRGNVDGTSNSALGFSSRFASPSLTNSTVIGSRAQVSTSNSIVLGSINGVNGATADTNVGIGTTAPTQRLHVVGNGLINGDLTVTGTLNANLPTNSVSYVHNTNVQQPASNFNISGSGSANILNAGLQYNIGGQRILSGTGNNIFAGFSSGQANTTGTFNAFFGGSSGEDNTAGFNNSFFGTLAGRANTTGTNNSFFGRSNGQSNTTGQFNSFFGTGSGSNNTIGDANSFFGESSGNGNTTGGGNAFFGFTSGRLNTTGNFNSFFGISAGDSNITGTNNTNVGRNSDLGSGDLTFATAIGANSLVTTSNTIKLGRTLDQVIAPNALLVGNVTSGRGQLNLYANTGNANLYMQGASSTVGINMGVGTGAGNPFFFISHYNGTTYTDRLVITSNGEVRINTLGSAGATALCRNGLNEIATCSSSMRYKSNVLNYEQSRGVLDRLRPVSFTWNGSNLADLGLVAEEVAEIEPLLVTYNDKGEVEGVKYDRIGVVLVNVVKEQQKQIEELRKETSTQSATIESFRRELEELRAIIRANTPQRAAFRTEVENDQK